MKLLRNKTELINVLHSILNAENDAPIEVTMLAFNAILSAHLVTWRARAAERYFAADLAAEAAQDIDSFAELCELCLDFTMMPIAAAAYAGEGPY